MEHPSQFTMEQDKYYISRKLLPLSATSAVMIERAASKPPDFEPLVTPDETKRLRAKVPQQYSQRNQKAAVSRRHRK
jgi:hypothetical protein